MTGTLKNWTIDALGPLYFEDRIHTITHVFAMLHPPAEICRYASFCKQIIGFDINLYFRFYSMVIQSF